MKEINLRKFQCLSCGSEKLEKIADGMYECTACGAKWKEENLQKFQDILHVELDNLRLDTAQDMLNIAHTMEAARKLEAVANLKQRLYEATGKKYVSNTEVKAICDDILKYFPEDFYANFYLATCQKDKTALGEFLQNVDVEERFADISMMLDYLIKGLNPGWTMAVGNFIERIKKIDTEIFNKYRTAFEEVNAKIEDSVFDPSIPRDVFVAYSSADMPKVEKLVCALEDEELTCFVAARNLRHGSGAVENYENAIYTAIEHCSVLVFVSSQNSRSVNCDAYELELQYIEKNRKNMPRVEYLTGDYSGKVIERYFKKFFSGLEYCTSVQQTVERVYDYIMNAEDVPVETTDKPKAKKVSVSDDIEESSKTEERRRKSEEARKAEDARIAEVRKAQNIVDKAEKYYNSGEYNKVYPLLTEALKLDSYNAKAQNLMGECYYYGRGVQQSYTEAVKWWSKAAEQGYADAQHFLGYCYENGQGVQQSYTEAVKWYRKAADQGHKTAQFRLSVCYRRGLGVKKDKKEAEKWWELSRK